MINDSMNNTMYKYTCIQKSCVASATVWNMKYRYIAPTGEQLGYDWFGGDFKHFNSGLALCSDQQVKQVWVTNKSCPLPSKNS